jgi:hypothetical protein
VKREHRKLPAEPRATASFETSWCVKCAGLQWTKELMRVDEVRRICPTTKDAVNETLRLAVDTPTVELALPLD